MQCKSPGIKAAKCINKNAYDKVNMQLLTRTNNEHNLKHVSVAPHMQKFHIFILVLWLQKDGMKANLWVHFVPVFDVNIQTFAVNLC